ALQVHKIRGGYAGREFTPLVGVEDGCVLLDFGNRRCRRDACECLLAGDGCRARLHEPEVIAKLLTAAGDVEGHRILGYRVKAVGWDDIDVEGTGVTKGPAELVVPRRIGVHRGQNVAILIP